MHVRIIKPKDATLGRFIRHFYFLKSDSSDFDQSYITFPQLTTPLSLFTRARTFWEPDRRRARCWEDPAAPPHGEIDGIFTRPMLITYRGRIDEVTVVFEPLGINQFVRGDLATTVGLGSQTFNPYGPVFDRFLRSLFDDVDLEKRCERLEAFFISQYSPFEHPLLAASLRSLENTDDTRSISEIARDAGVSHKTLTRLFQRHLGSTPVTLRKIARFRRSLSLILDSHSARPLTQISHQTNYYDQSQFIKTYHQLTGESPTNFLHNVSAINNGEILWKML